MFIPIYLSLPQALQILCHQPPSQVPAAYFWKASHPLRCPCVLKLPSCVSLWGPWGRSCPATLTSSLRSEQLSGTHREEEHGSFSGMESGIVLAVLTAHSRRPPAQKQAPSWLCPGISNRLSHGFPFLPSLLQFLLLA